MILGWSLTWGLALTFALLPSLSLELASLIFLALTFCYLLADCAADAALVGLSTLEPIETRGSILSTAYCIRFTSNTSASARLSRRRVTAGTDPP